jgi:hypothetical protein
MPQGRRRESSSNYSLHSISEAISRRAPSADEIDKQQALSPATSHAQQASTSSPSRRATLWTRLSASPRADASTTTLSTSHTWDDPCVKLAHSCLPEMSHARSENGRRRENSKETSDEQTRLHPLPYQEKTNPRHMLHTPVSQWRGHGRRFPRAGSS